MGGWGNRRGACAHPLDASISVWSTRLMRLWRRIDVTAMPEASKPKPTSTSIAATRLTRSGTPLGRCTGMPLIVRPKGSSRLPKHGPPTTQCVKQPRLSGIDLPAQVRDIGLDDVDIAAEVIAPDVVKDLRLTQHGARVDHEIPQESELGRRERYRFAGLPHLVGLFVEFDVGERETGGAGLVDAPAGAPKNHA